jgi:prepilin-type N-terminal cleavage/methylation domain-containing protein
MLRGGVELSHSFSFGWTKKCVEFVKRKFLSSFGLRPQDDNLYNNENFLFPHFPTTLLPSKKLAFTLAEVLVTLGIVGVVSALTIPSLVKNHQRQVYVTQLKKVVSELSQAAEKSINDNNAVSLVETKYGGSNNNIEPVRNFFLDNFKITNDCGENLTPCFADRYTNMNGNEVEVDSGPYAVFSLANGASIDVYDIYMTSREDFGYYHLRVDINGAQGPNIAGRDLFDMYLYSDGKVAETHDLNNSRDEEFYLEYCKNSDYGGSCLTKIMHDGWKMDY